MRSFALSFDLNCSINNSSNKIAKFLSRIQKCNREALMCSNCRGLELKETKSKHTSKSTECTPHLKKEKRYLGSDPRIPMLQFASSKLSHAFNYGIGRRRLWREFLRRLTACLCRAVLLARSEAVRILGVEAAEVRGLSTEVTSGSRSKLAWPWEVSLNSSE